MLLQNNNDELISAKIINVSMLMMEGNNYSQHFFQVSYLSILYTFSCWLM